MNHRDLTRRTSTFPSEHSLLSPTSSPTPKALSVLSAASGSDRGDLGVPGWLARILGVNLSAKIVGANALIAAGAVAASQIVGGGDLHDARILAILAGAVVGSLIVNTVLVSLALRPLSDLEATAQKILKGDISARVPDSPLADSDVRRVGGAINILLDQLTADRARVRELASHVIHSGDEERSRIARELHDSTAQSMAALLLELSVAKHDAKDAGMSERLERVRRIASDVLDEVRMLAANVHPRVLDDLGLGAALQNLARETEMRGEIRVEVVLEESSGAIPLDISSALYRVAQEALKNALRHAQATSVMLRAGMRGNVARLEVVDDGAGFHLDEAERRRPGTGLFTMRERVALLNGELDIESAPGRGTHLVATVPVASSEAAHSTGVGAARET